MCSSDLEGRDLVEKLWNRACDGRLQLNDEGLKQLALFYAAAQIEEPNLNLEPPPESLLSLIEAAAAKSDVTVSREQQDVSSTLTKLNIDHEMEVSPFESSNVTCDTSTMLNIDIGDFHQETRTKTLPLSSTDHSTTFNATDETSRTAQRSSNEGCWKN